MSEGGSTLDCGTSFAGNVFSIIFGGRGNFADLLRIYAILNSAFRVSSPSSNVGVVVDGGLGI